MATFELIMPKMGESIIEATILSWVKEVGDTIEQDEAILEIATDKVDSDVPSPVDGKLLEKRFAEGDVVPVGAIIALIETDAVEEGDTPHSNGIADNTETIAAEVPFVPQPEPVLETAGAAVSTNRFYSPLVLNIARKEGISMTELERVTGSGREGRVTKKDILSYVKQKAEAPSPDPEPVVTNPDPVVEAEPIVEVKSRATASNPAANTQLTSAPTRQVTFTHSGNYEIMEMDRMRKLIAKNMVNSTQTSAHVTSFVEADVTELVMWRNRVKGDFQAQYGEKLSFTPLFIQLLVKVLREHPLVNSSVNGDQILIKKDINVGMAVALPTDNLIVPVIKHADRLNLAGITAAVNDLADRARRNKLKPEELEGGTYTLSNVGTFGNVMGTPIILQPQVAILAVGAIRKLPAVLETPTGDVIAIRHKMFLSHSYDHRIIDGALGGRFIRRLADLMEAWDPNTEI